MIDGPCGVMLATYPVITSAFHHISGAPLKSAADSVISPLKTCESSSPSEPAKTVIVLWAFRNGSKASVVRASMSS